MSAPTIACLWVRGEYPFGVEYVSRLRRMLDQHGARHCALVCATDRAEEVPPGVVPYRINKIPGCFALWNKLQWFTIAPEVTRGRVLFLDLDVLVVGDLAPILTYPAPFALIDDRVGRSDKDRHGRRIVRRFNSSAMIWTAGQYTDLYTHWSQAEAKRLSTDQDWIGEQATHAVGMPEPWFPRISRTLPPWPTDAKVVLCKKPKNHVARDRWAWFDAAWGGV